MKSDTSPEVEARVEALLAQRSGSERVRMACEMFDLARALAVANIRAGRPNVTDGELRAQLFERFYGEDFTAVDKARIKGRLRMPRVGEHDESHAHSLELDVH